MSIHFFNHTLFLKVNDDPNDEVDRGKGQDGIKDRGRVCEPPQIKSHEYKVGEEDEKVQAMHEVECAFLAFTKFADQKGHPQVPQYILTLKYLLGSNSQ